MHLSQCCDGPSDKKSYWKPFYDDYWRSDFIASNGGPEKEKRWEMGFPFSDIAKKKREFEFSRAVFFFDTYYSHILRDLSSQAIQIILMMQTDPTTMLIFYSLPKPLLPPLCIGTEGR